MSGVSVTLTGQISSDCARCGTKSVAFSGRGSYRHTITLADSRSPLDILFVLLECGHCGVASLGAFDPNRSDYDNTEIIHISGLALLELLPNTRNDETPENISENVEKFYVQGIDNLERKNFDAAGAMFRKTLEQALREISPGGEGTLYNRIENLPEDRGLTKSMKEWAHEIRKIGNDAAHDEFNEDEARDLKQFTELFLVYAFTLPEKMRVRRNRAP